MCPSSRRFFDQYKEQYLEAKATHLGRACVVDLAQNPAKRPVQGHLMPALTTKTQRFSLSKNRFVTVPELWAAHGWP
eukprot:10545752-Alexandrium_andersonii.AAC.1